VATAAMHAMRRTETRRRTGGKNRQEQLVKDLLRTECGYREVAPRKIANLFNAPGPGEARVMARPP